MDIFSAGLISQDTLCCTYVWRSHLYSLSEVIGHKLSKVVPVLLAEVKEYAVTIAIHNCSCRCYYLGPSYRGAPGTYATKHPHRLNCYWLGGKSRGYLYIDSGMQLWLSNSLPLHALPFDGTHIQHRWERGNRGWAAWRGVVFVQNQIRSDSLKGQLWVRVYLPSISHAQLQDVPDPLL